MSQPAQRMVALGRANEIRLKRAAIRRRISTIQDSQQSAMQLARELEQRHECLQKLLVRDVLMWARRYGDWRAGEVMRHAGIGDFTTLSALSDRRLAELVSILRSPRLRDGREAA